MTAYTTFLDATLKPALEAYSKACGEGLRICVRSGTGHGDQARAMAFCSALRDAGGSPQVFILLHNTGAECMVELDYLHAAREQCLVVSGLPLPLMPRGVVIPYALPFFDILYDVEGYAVKTYWNLNVPRPEDEAAVVVINNWEDWHEHFRDRIHHEYAQLNADQRLAPWQPLYDGFPFDNWRLLHMPGLTQWDIMTATSGVRVDEDHLILPNECAPMPEGAGDDMDAGVTNWKRAKLSNVGKFALIHNGAGTGCGAKIAPGDVMAAIVMRLTAMDIKCVHLRFGIEPKIQGCIDRHNLRVPLVARLMLDPDCVTLVTTEGFPAYIAPACDLRAAVLFGPTPTDLFGMPQNLNLRRTDPETKQAPCPIGSCFWNAGPLARDRWCVRCAFGDGACRNFVEPEEAAGQVGAFVERLAK